MIAHAAQDCKWITSGDGAVVRNAVMIHHFQIGRVLRSRSGNEWVHGFVVPAGWNRPGLQIQDKYFDTYQVLTASKASHFRSVSLNYFTVSWPCCIHLPMILSPQTFLAACCPEKTTLIAGHLCTDRPYTSLTIACLICLASSFD